MAMFYRPLSLIYDASNKGQKINLKSQMDSISAAQFIRKCNKIKTVRRHVVSDTVFNKMWKSLQNVTNALAILVKSIAVIREESIAVSLAILNMISTGTLFAVFFQTCFCCL